MKKSSVLSRLALAGIAAGLVSVAPVRAGEKTMTEKSVKARKSGAKDTVKAGQRADTASVVLSKHDCAGKNACKGQGGCSMTEKDLKAAAKKIGIPREKAGKAHSCKGRNECKGLGGCSM